MGTMRAVMVGTVLVFLSGVVEAPAQVLLHVEQRRAEEIAEQRIGLLQSRAYCDELHATYRQLASATDSLTPSVNGATKDREALLREAEARFGECVRQVEAVVARQSCLNTARTEAQRSRCNEFIR